VPPVVDALHEVYLVPLDEVRDACIACAFTVEKFVDALHGGTFAFCPGHLLRAVAHGNVAIGRSHLRVLGPDSIA
jgi:hypothetical protein